MYTIKFAKDSRTLQIFILQKCQTKTTASPAGGIRGSDAVVFFLMLFRGFKLPQIAAQKGVKAAHCLLPSGVAVQL